jgi:glycosyltransferase involved in cell wall biosynthesis
MHVAPGYRWFPTALGYHIERVFCSLGHRVTYVGLSAEQRTGYSSGDSLVEIFASMPEGERPDLYLWIDPAGRYFPRGIEELPTPTACYLVDVHLGQWRKEVARFFDAVFVAQKDYVNEYRQAAGHDQVHWLPLAAASDVHYDHNLLRIYDVGFVGNLVREHRQSGRARQLKLIASRFNTNDVYGRYTPAQVGEIYSQSRIVFNSSIADDVTMRVFEGSACGAMVVTDAVHNGLGELFDVGQEIVTYADDADLMHKIEYYLAHENERARIAAAGQARTLAQHTYQHRAQTILQTVTANGFKNAAAMRKASPSARFEARRRIYTHLHMLDAIFDDARAMNYGPLRRLWAALPCLARRAVR